jgi:hypothetical protein
MKVSIFVRLSRFCFRALLVLLGWSCVDLGQVLADCRSHDLPVISLSNRSVIGLESLDRPGEPVLADPTEIPDRQKPCTGPMCSGQPSIPLAPASPDVQRIALWAILTVSSPLLMPEAFEARTGAPGVRSSHSPSSIFHPPRLASALINS